MSKTAAPTSPERLVSIPDTARRLSCSERQVWRLLRKGDLDRVCIGGLTRTTESSVSALINRSKLMSQCGAVRRRRSEGS